MESTSEDESNNTKKLYKCTYEECHAAFSKPCRLTIHYRKHTGERPFVCDIEGCNKSYTQIAHLKRHKCLTHDQAEEVVCEHKGCGLILNNKYALKKHYNRFHNPENYAFKCNVCLQGFQKKTQLQKHRYLHTGIAPYRCEKCDKQYMLARQYKRHINSHKKYICDCDEVFETWTSLLSHKKMECGVRKEHNCVICSKSFSSASNLKQHSLVHVEESQKTTYSCPFVECKRQYLYKKNLTHHIQYYHKRVQDSVKIKCKLCPVIFKSKASLKHHIQNIHSLKKRSKQRRKTRKDKGKVKKSMASTLSGYSVSVKENLEIIEKHSKQNCIDSENVQDGEEPIVIENVSVSNDNLVETQSNSQNKLDGDSSKLIENNMTDRETEVSVQYNDEMLFCEIDRVLETLEKKIGIEVC